MSNNNNNISYTCSLWWSLVFTHLYKNIVKKLKICPSNYCLLLKQIQIFVCMCMCSWITLFNFQNKYNNNFIFFTAKTAFRLKSVKHVNKLIVFIIHKYSLKYKNIWMMNHSVYWVFLHDFLDFSILLILSNIFILIW